MGEEKVFSRSIKAYSDKVVLKMSQEPKLMTVAELRSKIENKGIISPNKDRTTTPPKHNRQITEKELKTAAKQLRLGYGVIEQIINKVRENQSKHIKG